MPHRPAEMRLRQGLALLAGALAIALVLDADGSRFYLTPFAVGLTYLVAAALGGRRGGYWATAVVLVGWGVAVIVVRQAQPELDTAGLYLAGAGAGATIGMALRRAGFDVDPLGAAATVLAAGLILAFAPQSDVLEDSRTYAVLIGAVGLANVVAGALRLGRDDDASTAERGT